MKYYRAVVYYRMSEGFYDDPYAVIKNAHNINTPPCSVIVREIKETSEAKFLRAKENEAK